MLMRREKMRATAYFVKMTDAMYTEINSQGWDSEAGRRYHDAKEGKSFDRDMFEATATVDVEDAEEAWMLLQNMQGPWDANEDYNRLVAVLSTNNRSMDVGDLVAWDNGVVERVIGCGFETVEPNWV
jgi:hypothetical protein